MDLVAKAILTIATSVVVVSAWCSNPEPQRPNVIIIITDDLGYGDLGINGNPHVKTPVIDDFASESIRFNQFYVSPVCAPTRASLMTGRYSLRTGVRDTYNGGAVMAADEFTLAEMLKRGGYRTGIFGKWHLGDNYPSRPSDQGFDESLIHLGGGIGQPGDFANFYKGDSSYFDPVLWHNGQMRPYEGYCSDVFAEEAIRFISDNRGTPFFCYLAFNAPHTPLQLPEEYYAQYKDIDPSAGFPDDGRPFPSMREQDKEDAKKVYGMVTNIDDNVGKLLKALEELDVAENTIVIFMSDNGPQQPRYVSGMRGRKGSVFRGGVRVPFYFRFPARFAGDRDIDAAVAHIDIFPTLSALCQVEMAPDRKIDGESILPLLTQTNRGHFEERSLFFYWTRRHPELYNNIALQKGSYRLVGNTNYDAATEDFELFNFRTDAYEQQDIVISAPVVARRMKSELDRVIRELTGSSHLENPPRIVIGSDAENPVYLNRNDADGQRGIWRQEEVFGFWRVRVGAGIYNIRFGFINPVEAGGTMCLETDSSILTLQKDSIQTDIIEMKNVRFSDMSCNLAPYYAVKGQHIFPLWVAFERIGD